MMIAHRIALNPFLSLLRNNNSISLSPLLPRYVT
jgi:hypothetical protein